MKCYIRNIVLPFLLLAMMACNDNNVNIADLDFNPMVNFAEGDTVLLDMDMKNVVNQGIVIPSERQCDDGGFVFCFYGKKGLYYKIFYQNESYKFGNDNELNSENFYGSWEDVSIGFKHITSTGLVYDTVRIVGNPRDERKYYGEDITENQFNDRRIGKILAAMRREKDWYNSIVEKAAYNKVTVERQMYLDAIWMIREAIEDGEFNNRWKRNPRVGCYSFMLVICDKNALEKIPEYIKNIGCTDENGKFVNPYSFFANNNIDGVSVVVSDRVLKTRAILTPEYGLYLDDTASQRSHKLYSEALFEQFFSDVSHQYTLRNIPVIQDVVSDNKPYTRAQYEANKHHFDSTQLIYDYPFVNEIPGETVRVDSSDNSIVLVNPGNDDIKNLRKESTGIRTRVGFTYGKFRGKIKFPVMLNDDHMWNGLTNAFWLIYQNNHDWNLRRRSESGYIDKGDDSQNPERKQDNFYSEIDIEIVKAAPFWPENRKIKEDDPILEKERQNNDVMFCSTNWDLACRDPKKFKSGITEITYDGVTYKAARWNELYKALTSKTPISNDIFKEDYYYYEIEWRPTEIIWRVGPSPDNMQVVGYMNDEYTSIPNNQMLCIVTQEYHYSEWWPPVVFWQGLIPYNKSDIEGKVFEIVIE